MEEHSVLKAFVDLHAKDVKLLDKKQRWRRFEKKKPFSEALLAKESFQRYDQLKKKFTSESVLSCPKCQLNKVSCISRQIQRADESETFFASCLNQHCRHKWKFQ